MEGVRPYRVVLFLAVLCVPVAIAQTVTDPSGDAWSAEGYPISPDLVSATVSVSGGTATFDVQFAPGTRLDPQKQFLMILLDTDQDTTTGATWLGNNLGGDFGFFMWPDRQSVGAFNPVNNSIGGNTLITVIYLGSDTIRVPIPLSGLADDDGKFDFRIAAGVIYTTPNLFGQHTDYMPNDTLPPGTTGQGTAPPRIPQFTVSPQSIAAGQSVTLSWVVTGNATSVTLDGKAVAASGSSSDKPSSDKTYVLTAIGPGGSATARVTVKVTVTPVLAIGRFPAGMTQLANSAGGSDSFVVTNVGGGAAQVAVQSQAAFVSVTPQSFALPPGESQTVTLTGAAQAAGAYDGTVTVSTETSSFTVPVRMLSSAPPTGSVIPAATAPRVDVSSSGTTPATGSVTFTNNGSSTLNAIATADVPWIAVESGIITIAPGASRAVTFTVDPSLRTSFGSEAAKISLVYIGASGGPAANAVRPMDSSGTQTISVSLVHTKTPTVSGSSIPSIGNQPVWFLPGILRNTSLVTDLTAFLRPGSTGSASLSAYYLAATSPASTAKVASFSNVAASSTLPLADVVHSVFNDPAPSGSMQLRGTIAEALSLSGTVLNTARAQGLFGSSLTAFRSDRGVGQNEKIYLPGVRKDASTSTSIILQEVSGSDTTVATDFLDAAGRVVSSRTDALTAFSMVEAANAVPEGAVVAVLTNTGAGKIVARALLTDLVSGDVSDIVDWAVRNGASPADVQMVLFTGRSTELVITNRGSQTLTGALSAISSVPARRRAVRTSQQGATAREGLNARRLLDPQSLATEISLAPGQSTVYADALALLGAPEGAVVVFTPRSGSAAVGARMRVQSQAFGAFSTELPVVGANAGLKLGQSKEFGGIESSGKRAGSFQSSMVLLETSGKPATVHATLQFVGSSGSVSLRKAVTKDYVLKARQQLQVSDVARDIIGPFRDEFGDLHNMQLDLSVTEGEGRVLPVIALRETETGDLILRVD